MGKISVKEMVVFSVLGTIMFISKHLMEFLPNIHMVGMLITVYTVVYRKKALIPVYVFVMLEGAFSGFSIWWIPYLYIWTVLWAMVMLIPADMPQRIAMPVYMVVTAIHGLCYGTLYAPLQALYMGFGLKAALAWILAGLPWDMIHAIGNAVFSTMVIPLSRLLKRLEKYTDI